MAARASRQSAFSSSHGCYRAATFVRGAIEPDAGRATGGTLAGWFLLRLRYGY